MPRYIDADKLIKSIRALANKSQLGEISTNSINQLSAAEICGCILNAPNADVQEVRHGEWHTIRETTDSKTTECTACMKSFFFMRKGQLNIDLMPYCPHCGAKMDGEREEGNDNG